MGFRHRLEMRTFNDVGHDLLLILFDLTLFKKLHFIYSIINNKQEI